MHERFSNLNYIFYGILVCFFTIVLFLITNSLYIITSKGVNSGAANNIAPKDLMKKIKNFPIFTNILYT